MSKKEIKNEINKVLDQLSGKSLQGILSILKSIESKHIFSSADQLALDKILSEDKELLEKLAK